MLQGQQDGLSSTSQNQPQEELMCLPSDLPNGFFMERRHNYSLGESTEYGCQIGFTTLQGLDRGVTLCLAAGWIPTPKCIRTCTKSTDGTVIFNTTKSVFLLKEKVVYECEDGYETIKQGTGDQIICTEKGWHPKPGCLPIQCESPFLEDGDIKPKNDQNLHKDVVKFSCKRGYTRVGPDSAQCYYFGWSPPPPICKVQVNPCQPPPSIPHGRLVSDLRDQYPHGEKVEYECDLGFVKASSSMVECVDGEWTSLPSCIEEFKTCGPPPNIIRGHAIGVDSGKYIHGKTVAYECEENFDIVGTNPAKCLHGEWTFPSCISHARSCSHPHNITPTPLKYAYKNNDVFSYNCGFGLRKAQCVNGEWLPTPECKEFCPHPPQLPNAIHIAELRNYESGEEIAFRCKEHFHLLGPPKILCEGGAWQTPPRCVGPSR
ncbi:complement factor H-like isoform X2 [Varanus komodoensis]|uniref:complement factor H-like isoform X2 n=1 Tax=Varanus komodoensis TaxID=61221 RepID=UPI001CF778B3|nr:complement factor H-like isoform X2 [Varanus komodoensis]